MRLKPRRNGNVLALTAVILSLLLGVAALALDLALVPLTRRQMQTAVNTAALEGLRGRDDPNGADVGRNNASRFSALVFDDDLDPGNGDTLNLGAGPVLTFQGGTSVDGTSLYASRLITLDNIGVYKPHRSDGTPGLEVNAATGTDTNLDPSGDMVTGNPAAGPPVENPDYTRADFTPLPGSAPNPKNYSAFLVRMRRTGETFTAGVGSAGPPLPNLFGRGAISSVDFADRMERGNFVRATAIAAATPVKSAGPTAPGLALGVAPLGLDATFWQGPGLAFPPGQNSATVTLTVDLNPGSPTYGAITSSSSPNPVGYVTRVTSLAANVAPGDTTISVASTAGFPTTTFPFHVQIDQEILQVRGLAGSGAGWTVTRDSTMAAAHNSGQPVRQADTSLIGETFNQGTPNGFVPDPTWDRYIPLFKAINAQGNLVVGYGYAQVSLSGNQLTITKKDQIAEVNASASLARPIGTVNPALAATDVEAVFTANNTLGVSSSNPNLSDALRAPALARSIR